MTIRCNGDYKVVVMVGRSCGLMDKVLLLQGIDPWSLGLKSHCFLHKSLIVIEILGRAKSSRQKITVISLGQGWDPLDVNSSCQLETG